MFKHNFMNNKGFTLIEILGAITILAIVLLGLFTLFPQSANMQNMNEEKLAAINLSNLVLEDLRSINEISLSAGEYESFNQTGSLAISSVSENGQFIDDARFSLNIELVHSETDDYYDVVIKILDDQSSEVMRTYDLIGVAE